MRFNADLQVFDSSIVLNVVDVTCINLRFPEILRHKKDVAILKRVMRFCPLTNYSLLKKRSLLLVVNY